jgi:hypothetical protein
MPDSMMAQPSSTPAEVPKAHDGAHYDNPTSKPVLGPVSVADKTSTQRITWVLLFTVMAGVIGAGFVLGLLE